MTKRQAKRKPSDFCEPMVDLAESIDAVCTLVEDLTDHTLRIKSKFAHEELPFLIIQFGLETVLEAIEQGYEGYNGNMAFTLEKLGGICMHLKDPAMQTDHWIISRFDSYFPDDFDRGEAKALLHSVRTLRGDEGIKEIEEMSKDPAGRNWEEQKQLIKAAVYRGWVDAES